MKYPAINRLFTFTCFAIPPILGSVVTFVWHGGALWCILEIARGRRRFSADRSMWLLAGLLYLYVLASALSFLLNGPSWEGAKDLLPFATLLLFPFSYSLWSISDKAAIARAAAYGSMVASYAALLYALPQHFFFNMRPEGGAGNALVFSTIVVMTSAVSLAGALMLETRWRLAFVGG